MDRPEQNSASNPGKFLFVGEHAALDFANTLLADHGEPVERLIFCADVLEWAALAGLIDHAERSRLNDELKSPARQGELLDDVRSLRALWKQDLHRLTSGREPSAELVARLNHLLKPQSASQAIEYQKSTKTFHLRWQPAPLPAAQRVLALLAGKIAEFLASAHLAYLRQCAGPDCVIFFYDTTKSHRRQWCSMAICGNRHKVAKFRARNDSTSA